MQHSRAYFTALIKTHGIVRLFTFFFILFIFFLLLYLGVYLSQGPLYGPTSAERLLAEDACLTSSLVASRRSSLRSRTPGRGATCDFMQRDRRLGLQNPGKVETLVPGDWERCSLRYRRTGRRAVHGFLQRNHSARFWRPGEGAAPVPGARKMCSLRLCAFHSPDTTGIFSVRGFF